MNVAARLESIAEPGGIYVSGNRALIDATTGGHIWADRIKGALDDVFEMQEAGEGRNRTCKAQTDREPWAAHINSVSSVDTSRDRELL